MPGQTSDGQCVKYAGSDGQIICGSLLPAQPGIAVNVPARVNVLLSEVGATDVVVTELSTNGLNVSPRLGTFRAGALGEITGARINGTLAVPLTLQAADDVARLRGRGFDGTAFGTAAFVNIVAAEIWAVGAHGSEIGFFTVPIGATGGVRRWDMKSDGMLLAGADNSYDIGATGATRPRRVYCGTALQVEGDGAVGVTSGLCLTNQTVSVGASAGTLTNAPAVGNPTVWLRLNINGAVKQFPGW